MKVFCATLLLTTATALAQPTCETLLNNLTRAFEEAHSVVSVTEVTQGGRELSYQHVNLVRDAAGTLQPEVIESRGRRGPEDGGGDGEFEFHCEGHSLEAINNVGGWKLTVLEPSDDIPVESYDIFFKIAPGRYVPERVEADFSVTVLVFPVRGTFTTSLSDWTFPPR